MPKCSARQRIIPLPGCAENRPRLGGHRARDRQRQVRLFSRGRRYSHEHRAALDRKDRRRRRQAAHGAQPQRPGGAWTCGSICATKWRSSWRLLLKTAATGAGARRPKNTSTSSCPATPIYNGRSRCLLSHHLLAYYDMFERDCERFAGCLERINVLPLGSGAIAGTTFPIDRVYVAKLLGFPRISKNSIDAVSDRDFLPRVSC